MRAPFTLPLLLCVACNGPGASNTAPTNNRYVLPIGPRFQWEENNGYCGETSLISAGLYYGQYGSQYDARAYASDGADQSRPTSQLLLGVNEDEAATAMHLEVTRWHGDTPEDFLAWVKQNFLLGYPVIIGVFNNENRLYGETAADAGDAEDARVGGRARVTPCAHGRVERPRTT